MSLKGPGLTKLRFFICPGSSHSMDFTIQAEFSANSTLNCYF